MVWYGATDPRGKLDFFRWGGVQISAITSQFFSFFCSYCTTTTTTTTTNAVTLTATAIQPVSRYSLCPFVATLLIAESQ